MKIHLQTPEEIRPQIWKELGRASLDRHHEWRTPVLASADADGLPDARTVVLRQVDAGAGLLTFYTDSRSPKVAQLQAKAPAMLVFWSARLSWQLRVRVTCSVITSGPEVEALWQGVKQSAAAGDYLSPLPPGALLPPASGMADAPKSSVPAPTHSFALLRAQVLQMDWLALSRDGHRRAQLSANTWEWLTP
ncbi:pyridoxamine 5'-phosphate oxidase family protein [Limnohabitans sp. 2KL-3]|uniref:pyridoxamine 5'-phosphate oxidase family protein n=1 Tax=Limnohabitans sp. 2KL-3 TaxID=1100700 RepID=UPI000B7E3FA5|nr:pyridoxamine 5'-phosphate oxidase family protein [Limnohabitans sp. 2KL-3]